MEKIYCPNCGWEVKDLDYNYETGNTDFYCHECGERFSDAQLVFCDDCGEQIIGNDGMFTGDSIVCKNCMDKYL